MDTKGGNKGEAARPLQFVKVLSIIFFVLIVGFSLASSIIITNRAEKDLLEKQKEFGLLLAENLSHQIYTRFALPTLVGYGRIQLNNATQYTRLDQTVQSTIHSFNVQSLRIYDPDAFLISYSLDRDELGGGSENLERAQQALAQDRYVAEVDLTISRFRAFFSYDPPPGTMLLHVWYPLRAQRNLEPGATNPIMGVVEFTQDITGDYTTVLNYQRMVVGSSLFFSILLFIVIMVVLRWADKQNVQRVREREKLERELHQQEKLAGMGRMVAGVAHEIRNPLGIIQSSAELLLKKAQKEGGNNTRLLEALFAESKRLSRTVNDFLDYARPRQPARLPVDLGRVLDQVAVFLESECEKSGVRIEREPVDDVVVAGDKDLLYRAVYNVVGNAVQSLQAGRKGGTITLGAGPAGGDGPDMVVVSVADDGPGFDEETLDKLTDPFFTTKDDGTGLGLAIVNSIVSGHGGRLELACGVNGGAVVRIILPVNDPADEA